MAKADTVIAVFADHRAAEAAIKALAATGLEMKNLSLAGKGYHTAEKVIGFCDTGDRIQIWGARGVFWSELWNRFSGGVFMTMPVVGHIILLGHLARKAVSLVEGSALVGSVSAFGAALYGIGLPKDSVIRYETAMKADGFLVMAHGTAEETGRAWATLDMTHPTQLHLHAASKATEPVDHLVRASG